MNMSLLILCAVSYLSLPFFLTEDNNSLNVVHLV